jgi:hypothetical protein
MPPSLLRGQARRETAVTRRSTITLAGALPATATGDDPDAADASAQGTASVLELLFYGRISVDSLRLDGDRRIFDQLIAWDPDA